MGLPQWLSGRESTCNARDQGSIPGLGKSPGGGHGKPLQYSSLETQVRSLGQEDPLEEKMPTHSSIFAWRIPWTEEPGRLQSIGLQRIGHD